MSAEHDRLLALQAVQEATARAEAAEAEVERLLRYSEIKAQEYELALDEVERLTTELAHYKHGLTHEDIERIGRERDQAHALLRLCQPWIAHLHARDVADRVRALLDGAA